MTEEDASAESRSVEQTDQLDSAIDRFRETAKWLVAAFGAIGATLIASLELGGLGQLEGADELFAVIGLALGVSGVLLALVAAAAILATTRVTLGEIRRSKVLHGFVQREPWLLSGYKSVEDLVTEYEQAASTRIAAYRRRLKATDAASADEADRMYNRANLSLELANPAVDRLLGAVLFEKVQRRWRRRVLPLIALGVLLTAVGMAFFATQAPDDPPSADAVAATPVRGFLHLSSEGRDELGESLGEACDLTAVEVVVLASSDDASEVVTTDDRCNARRFRVTQDDGRIDAATTVPLPAPPTESPSDPTRTR